MDIKKILDDLDLISGVIPDYTAGRRRGLTDAETERIADAAIAIAIKVVEAYQEKETPCPPVKIIRENFMIKYYCPICNNDEIRGCDYCSRCGKKLDWYTEVLRRWV